MKTKKFVGRFVRYLLYFGGVVFWVLNIDFFIPIPSIYPIIGFFEIIQFAWFLYWMPFNALVLLCYTVIVVCISYLAYRKKELR